ncbi:MAG: DUF2784 domain-containing protein [Myxococcota bacterium]
MLQRVPADLVLVLHAAFVVFAMLGGLLVLRWRRLLWLHLPAVAWGALVELNGWICPLTPLESSLRVAAGDPGQRGDFIEHQLDALLYPTALTRGDQIALGVTLLVLNAAVYALVLRRRMKR